MSEPTLTEFLLLRIAEDEAAWATSRHGYSDLSARVLAECEAKRSIVELAADVGSMSDEIDNAGRYGPRRDRPDVAHLILCALALPYADHEAYRAEWKP